MGSNVDKSAKSSTEYRLSRGGIEAVRLTAQHYMLIGRQGWLLHPEIVESTNRISSPRVVDVACGTGIWCMDLAQQMPHADVVGLDISDKQFNPSWTWPSNVSLGLYDLLEDVPDELRGVFDIVHVRLLLAAGPRVDKSIFIDKFRTLLKPNGWLQWDDLAWPNIASCFPSSDKQGVKIVSMETHPIVQIASKYFGWHERLSLMNDFETFVMESGGFDKAQVSGVPMRPHLLQIETDLCVNTLSEFVGMLIKMRGYNDPTVLKELNDAVEKLQDGAQQGASYSYRWNVGIARRA